eukprot:gene3337-8266_t
MRKSQRTGMDGMIWLLEVQGQPSGDGYQVGRSSKCHMVHVYATANRASMSAGSEYPQVHRAAETLARTRKNTWLKAER